MKVERCHGTPCNSLVHLRPQGATHTFCGERVSLLLLWNSHRMSDCADCRDARKGLKDQDPAAERLKKVDEAAELLRYAV